ncbi:MAG: gephyrin-like molybdotransferase Glp [Solirubrobacteraceae bacterium]
MADELITIEQARQEVLAMVQPLQAERVQIAEALDRVLAQTVEAEGNVPPFSSSAMDGYALRAAPSGTELRVVGESRAGMPTGHRVGGGEAIRISTGAAVPAGADAVIRQEDVEEQGASIRILVDVPAGDNVRPAGEVMASGTRVLPRGTVLGPAEIAAAISAGAGAVMVGRRPRARVLSTGDELRDPGKALGPGEIHDSNGPMLAALAAHAGAIAAGVERLPDDPVTTERGLARALDDGDVVIVAGGVSVGPHDHVKPALSRLDVRERFWRVALQPGKPTWFGTRGRKLVFGLPGNPVSAAVTFALFVAPAISALQGASQTAAAAEAVLGEPVRRSRARQQAIRVRLERRDGALVAIPNGPQGSHVITSLVGADALALIPTGEGVLEPGTVVGLQPLPR